ncbi:MAG: MBOAT family protein, partial [Clostridia bacterium]|nr:MBOAT family protein [Clostridia bacterium]
GLFGAGGIPFASPEALYYLKSYAIIFILALVGATPVVKTLATKAAESPRLGKAVNLLEPIALVVLLVVITGYLVDGSFNPFLYFRF